MNGKQDVARYTVQASAERIILLVPWGDLATRDGRAELLKIDQKAADAIIVDFDAGGVDLVIDYEHQSEPGATPAPDGKALAAGWVRHGSLEAHPGRGIYGRVEWTEAAAAHLKAKEYKYLSPAIHFNPETGEVFRVSSIALTNSPALKGAAPVVYKQRPAKGGVTVNLTEFAGMVREKSGKSDLTDEQALDLAAELLGEVYSGMGNTAVSLNSVRARLQQPDTTALYKKIDDAQKANAVLQAKLIDAESEILIDEHPGKVPPSQVEWFKSLYARDPGAAKEYIKSAPQLIHAFKMVPIDRLGEAKRPAAGGSREGVIARARAMFRSESSSRQMISTERAFVSQELAEAGYARLGMDDARALGIPVE